MDASLGDNEIRYRRGMWILIVSVVAAAAAGASAYFVWLQVREMGRQTDLQRELAESSAQPYVWVDLRVQAANSPMLELVVGNSGPTVATNVQVEIQPPLPDVHGSMTIVEAQKQLADGLASIAPGRTITWEIGVGFTLLEQDARPREIAISCDGPYGPVPVSRYTIALADLSGTSLVTPGTLRELTKAVDRATSAIERGRSGSPSLRPGTRGREG